jgi:putative membrane protein
VGGGRMMMMSMMGWGMQLFMILLYGLIIYGILSLIMKAFEKKEDPAILILKERFARGEISQEEYEERSRYLKGTKS